MNILHLSDLHFNQESAGADIRKKWETIYHMVEYYRKQFRLDAVAVTGDLTCHGAMAEFELTYRYLEQLEKISKVPRQQFWICAGNHDADTPAAGSSFSHYETFYREFFPKGQFPAVAAPDGVYGFHILHTSSQTSLEDFYHAVLPEKDLPALLSSCTKFPTNILLIHHQAEVLRNPEALDCLQGKINLVLSGHLHARQPRIYTFHGLLQENGMAVTPHLPQIPSGFQILQLSHGKLQNLVPCLIG